MNELKELRIEGRLGGSVGWRPTSSQVVISRFMGSSPTSGSVLTAQSLEPVWDSVTLSLSAPPSLTLCLSLSQRYINIKKKIFFKELKLET